MENKENHIDHFLFQQLNTLEQVPEEMAFDRLMLELENLHPIDYALNQTLSDVEPLPDSSHEQLLFAAIANNDHPIDAALNKRLSSLESEPKQGQWQVIAPQVNQSNFKGRRILLLLFLALTIATSIYLFNDRDKSIPSKETLSNTTIKRDPLSETKTKQTKDENKTTEDHDNIQYEKVTGNIQLNPSQVKLRPQYSKSVQTKTIRRKYKQGSNHWMFETDEQTADNYTDENISALKYINLKKTNSVLAKDTIDKINSSIYSPPSYFKKRLSPLFFGASFGFINEHTVSNSISNRNIHKDAVSVFSQATGINRNGYTMNLYSGYRINRNFSIKTGLIYSRTSVNSDMDYTFTDIPIFSADGTIKKYGTRPAASSPIVKEDNKNENTNLLIPLQVSLKCLEVKKLSIWLDAGARIMVKNQFNTRLFSFLTAELVNTNNIKQQKLTPTTAINFQYQLRPYLHITSQFTASYQQKIFYLENYYFKKNEITPAFNIGIIFNPLIKQR